MQTENYWRQFECTGKIEDYLSYKAYHQSGCCSEDSFYHENDSRRTNGSAGCKSDYRERPEYAGNHRGYGDDLKTITLG